MAETNLKIDIRWLTPKTCLLPHPRCHAGVKFHEFVITQLLGEIENLFSAQKMRKTQVSISDKRKILPYFILKKVITEKLFFTPFSHKSQR